MAKKGAVCVERMMKMMMMMMMMMVLMMVVTLIMIVSPATGPAAALSDIALSKCEVTFTPETCSDSDCGRRVVKVTSIADFTKDGDRSTRIITVPVEQAPAVWTGYDPPDAFVSIYYCFFCILHIFLWSSIME